MAHEGAAAHCARVRPEGAPAVASAFEMAMPMAPLPPVTIAVPSRRAITGASERLVQRAVGSGVESACQAWHVELSWQSTSKRAAHSPDAPAARYCSGNRRAAR